MHAIRRAGAAISPAEGRIIMNKAKYKNHMQTFLQVIELLKSEGAYAALNKAYHKPVKWYDKKTRREAAAILKAEAQI